MFFILLSAALCPLMSFAAVESVKASSFGFDAENATACLQKAIDSGAKKVIVDNTGKPWIIAPVKLRSNLELVFADGVEVKALPGSYRHKADCMFAGGNVENVTLRGEGKVLLEMRKKDLCKNAGISMAPLTKMGKGGHVTSEILMKICVALDCTFDEIAEIVREDE
jgi:DNA-binding Xre family transcriptional regulator